MKVPTTCHRRHRVGVDVYLHAFFTSALDEGGGGQPHTPGALLVPIVKEGGLDPGPVCTDL